MDGHFVRFFLPRILAFVPALWGFCSQVYDHFLTNAHIYALKKSPYIEDTSWKVLAYGIYARVVDV